MMQLNINRQTCTVESVKGKRNSGAISHTRFILYEVFIDYACVKKVAAYGHHAYLREESVCVCRGGITARPSCVCVCVVCVCVCGGGVEARRSCVCVCVVCVCVCVCVCVWCVCVCVCVCDLPHK